MSAYDDLFGGNALLQTTSISSHTSLDPSSNELSMISSEFSSNCTTDSLTEVKKKGIKPSNGAQKVSTTARRVPVIPASWTQRYQSNSKPTPPTVVKAKVPLPASSKISENFLSSLDKKSEDHLKNLQVTAPALEELHAPGSTESSEKGSEKITNVKVKKKAKKNRGTTQSYYEETYDPTRPNDYEAYKKWRKEIHLAKHPVPLVQEPSPPSYAMNEDVAFLPMDLSTYPLLEDISTSEEDEEDIDMENGDPIDGYPFDPPFDISLLPEFLRLFMEGTGDQDQLLQALLSQLEKMSSSRVVLLCNMVDPGDVDDDLKVETAEECSKFGKVLQCYVHEIVGPQLPSDAVRIFVEFDKPEAAQQAISELNGRFFSGRKVTARLYDNHSFHQHAYEE